MGDTDMKWNSDVEIFIDDAEGIDKDTIESVLDLNPVDTEDYYLGGQELTEVVV
jgi:hypothetical protein